VTTAEFARLLIDALPAVGQEIRELAGMHGIDLGPEPPDLKVDAAAVDKDIEALLRAKFAAKRDE
jgi:hypothetical protein